MAVCISLWPYFRMTAALAYSVRDGQEVSWWVRVVPILMQAVQPQTLAVLSLPPVV